MSSTPPPLHLDEREQAWVRVIIEKIRALKFGTVHIKIHESQVVVIESTEQTRFELGAKQKP
jgi:hypothetical protein